MNNGNNKKSAPVWSVSVPYDEREQISQKFDKLMADVGAAVREDGKPVSRSGLIQDMIRTGQIVGSDELSKLAAKANIKKGAYVVFYVPAE